MLRRRSISTGSGRVNTASRIVSTADDSTASELGSTTGVKAKDKGKEIMQESEPPKKSDPVVLRYHAQLNRPYFVAEVRKNMVIYLKNQGGYKMNYFKGMKYEDIKPIFEKKSLARKRAGEKQSEENTKRQKIEDDVEKEELKAYLDLVLREEFAMEIESLATKYPIVDWKTHVLTKNFMYYQIFRADRSSKNYKIFSKMLDDFDIHDVLDLYRLVKARYITSSPEGYDLMLWGYLKIQFESDEEDEVWRNQHEYNLISWRLFDPCGIHILLMNNGIAIHMMIEKKYPLTQEMLSKMLSRKLKVDHENEMAFELVSTSDALVKSYKLDKDLFKSYSKVYSLKIDREDQDKDEDPPAASDQGLKKQKTSKDTKPSRGSKLKDSKLSSSKGTKSQPKSSSKSAQAEEPVCEAVDIEMPLNQGDDLGNTDDQPNVEAVSRDDWFKNPERPSTPYSDWNTTKTINFRPP
ncbi:hypothetical protein Tco_0563491 [Tanacetum coccineum]